MKTSGHKILFIRSPKGSREGIVVIALASHKCGRGKFWTRGQMWIKVVTCSLFREVFSRFSDFRLELSSVKTHHF